MAFIERAQATPAAAGRLIVATARPSFLEAVSHWASADGEDGRHRLHLSALPPAAAADLIRALAGEALPPDLIDRVAAASDGNPLFIEELLRTWVSVGLLERAGAGWRLTADAPDVPVAPTVQAIYAAQLDDLPADARRLTRHGSVAGRRVPHDFLGSIFVGSIGDVGAATAIASLLQRDLFAGPADDPPLGASYTYRHVLLRDAGYASLARSERAVLHVEFARWVERLLAGQPDVAAEWVGEHLEAAVQEAPALAAQVAPGLDRPAAAALAADWLERAAEAAIRRAARDRAVDLWSRALALTSPDARLAAARRERRLGETIADAGRFEEATERLGSALERFRGCLAGASDGEARSAAREGLAGAADSLARILLEQVRFEDGWTLAEAVLEEIGPGDDLPSARLRLRAATGHNYFSDASEDLLPAAVASAAIAQRDGDPELELEARLAITLSLSAPAEILRELVPVQRLAARLGRPDIVSRILRVRAMVGATLGVDPFPLLDEAADVAVSHGLDEALGWAEYARAETAFGLGRWDLAWDAGLRAVDVGERHGYRRIVVRTWHVLCPIAGARRDLDLLRRAAAWYAAAESSLPASPYGLLQAAAIHAILARLRVEPPRPIDPGMLMPSFDLEADLATWIEGVDEVLRRWIDDQRLEAVDEAIRRTATALERYRTASDRRRWRRSRGDWRWHVAIRPRPPAPSATRPGTARGPRRPMAARGAAPARPAGDASGTELAEKAARLERELASVLPFG